MRRFFLLILLITVSFPSFSEPVKVTLVANNQVDTDVRVVTLALSVPKLTINDDQAFSSDNAISVEKILNHLSKNKHLSEYSFDKTTSTFTIITDNNLNVEQLIDELNKLIYVKEGKK